MTHQSKFSIGNTVQIIDHDESCYEWATFVITNFDSGCYLLSGLDKPTYEPLWVTSYEICLVTLESKN